MILNAVETLAHRIEEAYDRRFPRGGRPTDPRVWTAAAVHLLRLHRSDPIMPLDPELYVASQPIGRPSVDPWSMLARPGSVRRYRRRVHRIIHQLRRELCGEVRRFDGWLRLGKAPEAVLLSKSRRALSPLGSYIVAHRIGRLDLAELLRGPARVQHQSCPLYRQACLGLLPDELYPVPPGAGSELQGSRTSRSPSKFPQFSLN